jgi:hypothetical protein
MILNLIKALVKRDSVNGLALLLVVNCINLAHQIAFNALFHLSLSLARILPIFDIKTHIFGLLTGMNTKLFTLQ